MSGSVNDTDVDDPVTKSEANVQRLLELRRLRITEDHITDFDKLATGNQTWDGEDDKKREVPKLGPEGKVYDKEFNLSKIFAEVPSTTANKEVLFIEAELLDEKGAYAVPNPHIPSTDELCERVSEQLEQKGLRPAWEVIEQ